MVFVKQDFSTYGMLLIASAIVLLTLFAVNIAWTIRNMKRAERDDKGKTPPEK